MQGLLKFLLYLKSRLLPNYCFKIEGPLFWFSCQFDSISPFFSPKIIWSKIKSQICTRSIFQCTMLKEHIANSKYAPVHSNNAHGPGAYSYAPVTICSWSLILGQEAEHPGGWVIYPLQYFTRGDGLCNHQYFDLTKIQPRSIDFALKATYF